MEKTEGGASLEDRIEELGPWKYEISTGYSKEECLCMQPPDIQTQSSETGVDLRFKTGKVPTHKRFNGISQ